MVQLSDLSQLLNFRGFELPSNDSMHSTQRWMSEPAPELHLWKLSLIVWNDRDKLFSAKKKEEGGQEKERKSWLQLKVIFFSCQAGKINMHLPIEKKW